MKPAPYLLACLLILVFSFLLVFHATAAINIDTCYSTESTCQANGIIEVAASGTGAPFIYSITTGPLTRPSQSSRFFYALPAGSYTVQVQNQSGETSSLDNVVITGTYQLMTLRPIPVISCDNSANGFIIGNRESGGLPPYTWQLVAPSPVTTTPQATDTFYNLPDGSYTLRATDGCGNFQTTGAVLSSLPSSLTPQGYSNYLLCNNAGTVLFDINYTNLQFPTTVTTFDDMGDSVVFIINDFNGYQSDGSWNIFTNTQTLQVSAHLNHSVYGGCPWHAVITNACGVSLTFGGQTATVIYPVATGAVPGSCPPKTSYSYNSMNMNGYYTVLTPDSLKYYLFDVTLNMATDSGYSHNPNVYVSDGIAGHIYRLMLINTCGVTFTSEDWLWENATPPAVYTYPVGTECLDSTISMQMTLYNFNYTSPIRCIIKSGPPVLQSSKPGFAYQHQLTYPDTLINTWGGFEFRNLPPGVYTYIVEDSCGQFIDSSFTILPSDLDIKRYTFNSVIVGQCGIFNAINLFITRGDKYAYPIPLPHFTYTITNISTGQIIETDNVVDSVDKVIYNIPNGTYTLMIDFFPFNPPYFSYLNNNAFCTTILDTIVVAGSPFPHINAIVNSFCQANVTTQIVIDSAGGVPPYTFEIIAGPQTFPPQASPFFQLPFTGTYTFRVVDACGNSYVSATDIDTLRFPPIEISNTPCPGANVLLIPLVSPFYSYYWTLPNGTHFYGDTLSVLNVAANDTGIYYVTRYADIYGCRDTVHSTLHLEMLTRVSQTSTVCHGDTLMVGTHAHFVTGIYIDTLSAALGCDSIVTTSLTVIPPMYGSQTLTVCQNVPIMVGTHVHYNNDTSVHLYLDTLVAGTGCDSIVTTHITIKGAFSQLTTINACHGDTITLPRELHFATSTIIDTAVITASQVLMTGYYQQTNGCDSIYAVNVIVNPVYFTVKFDTICQGQSILFGNQVCASPGGYIDTLTATSGCDSVILLVLHVRPADTTFISQTVCTGVPVNGHSSSGVYTDTLQNSTGCDSIVILTLNVVTFLQDSVVRQICAGQAITVGNHTHTQTGLYRDTLPTANCDSIVILNLTVNTGAHDTLTKNICSGQQVLVGTHSYNQPGIYADTIATTGCDSIVVLYLSVSDYKRDSTTYFICEGKSIEIGGNLYDQQGTYRDTLSSAPCDSISIVSIYVMPAPVISISADKAIAGVNEPVQLTVTSGSVLNYLWTSAGQLNSNTIPNPVGLINAPTWFVVSASDSDNVCAVSDSIFIDLLKEGCDKSNLFIPNSFTPNADGNNDVFELFTVCLLQKLEVKIFNRWGEKVFESFDPGFKWNGYYKGELQSPAVFVYLIKGAFADGESFSYKGSLTLIR